MTVVIVVIIIVYWNFVFGCSVTFNTTNSRTADACGMIQQVNSVVC
jgi:hypothetical protein